jgi:hypothetical protein
VTIISIGAGQVDLAHQNTNSTAANRMINFVTSASSSLAAGKGTATFKYDATTARWRLVGHFQGAAITIAYASGNFGTFGGGTWTVDSGDVVDQSYTLVNNIITYSFNVFSTTVSAGTGGFLTTAGSAVGGFTIAKIAFSSLDYYGTDPRAIGSAQANTDQTIYFSKADGTNWSAGTNNTAVRTTMTYQVT